jgi:hypothetical protein
MSICRWIFCLDPACVYACLSSGHTHVCTHIDSTSGLVWRTVLRPHTSASSVLPSPLPTRMFLHHVTPSHIPPCLMYSASTASSLKRQAWGIRQALCALFSHPTPDVSLSPIDASMQTQAAGHREPTQPTWSAVCCTMVHSARTPTTRPLPRPAATASRHATSRAMQVTSALLLSQAGPAALFLPHSPCLSLVFTHGPTLRDTQREGGG